MARTLLASSNTVGRGCCGVNEGDVDIRGGGVDGYGGLDGLDGGGGVDGGSGVDGGGGGLDGGGGGGVDRGVAV